MKRRIGRRVALGLLLLLPASAQTSTWEGTYRAVSAACGKAPLTIGRGWFTYMDCIQVKTSALRDDANQYLFQAAMAKCSMATWAFSMRRESAKDVVLTAFSSKPNLDRNLPEYECTFERQPAKKQALPTPPTKARPRSTGNRNPSK